MAYPPIFQHADVYPVPQGLSIPFPGLCNIVHQALCRAGVPWEIASSVLIAMISLLTQGVADVLWPNGFRLPIGMSVQLVANSAFGKSLILKILGGRLEQLLEQFSSEDGAGRQPDFLMENCTPEGLLLHVKDWPIVGAIMEEGALVKQLLRSAATLVKLIDGAPLRVSRATTGRFTLREHRLMLLSMVQPEIFAQLRPYLGGQKGSLGCENRIFFAQSFTGVASESLDQLKLPDSVQAMYDVRVESLFDATIRTVSARHNQRPAVGLDTQAKEFVSWIAQDTRRPYPLGHQYASISEYVARHAERVLRLAGALHVFEYGPEGEITVDTVQRADQIGRWHIEEFRRLFYEPPKASQVEGDAYILHQFFCQALRNNGGSPAHFKLSELRAHAINFGLTTGRFNRAITYLGGLGKVWTYRHERTQWLAVISA